MTSCPDTSPAGGGMPPAGADGTVSPASAGGMVRVWDPLVRIFHWSLVALVAIAWLTGDEVQKVHEPVGYVIAGLLAFRLVWGVIGSRFARFTSFVRGPGTTLGYLRDIASRKAGRHLGHNPAGAAMIVVLILVLSGTALTGYMQTTDTFWGVDWVSEVHEVLANLVLVLVALHLLGVLVASLEHGENLVKSMITGLKRPL
ncbi:cytochrome b/b6 domain-containing protein [Roseibium litorale]|uniref:Cytochrome b/b6 domain-containing protein n=1 Tax=Roseibium litorale TaxID=2803841 RepID=A0ABR9CT13_9HYPH|nr:cytochrome b/b6 domain-containing protein [Roseibium litorale]MBD8893545.1 cytochrome b/b6 domain-containing protein [Roseibium litorale]